MNPTHFGYQQVDESEKARKVEGVFTSVAQRYDVMNDLMSGGLHRLWKKFTIDQSYVRPGERVLDVAGGTADLSRAFARRVSDAGYSDHHADRSDLRCGHRAWSRVRRE